MKEEFQDMMKDLEEVIRRNIILEPRAYLSVEGQKKYNEMGATCDLVGIAETLYDKGYRNARDVEAETKSKTAKEIYLFAYQFISTAANPEPMFHKFMQEFEKKYGFFDLFGGEIKK